MIESRKAKFSQSQKTTEKVSTCQQFKPIKIEDSSDEGQLRMAKMCIKELRTERHNLTEKLNKTQKELKIAEATLKDSLRASSEYAEKTVAELVSKKNDILLLTTEKEKAYKEGADAKAKELRKERHKVDTEYAVARMDRDY